MNIVQDLLIKPMKESMGALYKLLIKNSRVNVVKLSSNIFCTCVRVGAFISLVEAKMYPH